MTIAQWVGKVAWTAFTKWIQRDPARAETRLAVLAEKYIEILIAALETQAATPTPGTITFVPKT